MIKRCPVCGIESETAASFCTECGTKLVAVEEIIEEEAASAEAEAPEEASASDENDEYSWKAAAPETAVISGSNMDEAMKWTSWKGRLNRKRYFFRTVGFTVVYCLAATFASVLAVLLMDASEATVEGIVYFMSIPFAILVYFNTIKRLHDLDKSGWYLLLNFVPIINVIFSLYLIFVKGTDGPNGYGEDPLKD